MNKLKSVITTIQNLKDNKINIKSFDNSFIKNVKPEINYVYYNKEFILRKDIDKLTEKNYRKVYKCKICSEIDLKCTICNGSGKITKSCQRCSKAYNKDCKLCHGTKIYTCSCIECIIKKSKIFLLKERCELCKKYGSSEKKLLPYDYKFNAYEDYKILINNINTF